MRSSDKSTVSKMPWKCVVIAIRDFRKVLSKTAKTWQEVMEEVM